jgi:pilus assembly protein CpaB
VKTSYLTALALVIAAVASFFVARSLGIVGSSSVAPSLVIAALPIEPGMAISSAQVKEVPWPTGSTPDNAFDRSEAVVNRVARQMIYPGEPVLESRLAPIESRGGLSSVITPGKRAVTVRVNDVVAVAGFTLPGSHVDVMVNAKDAAGNPFSKIVLNRVKVLAIAQETSPDQTKPKVVNAVTLELSPQESERLDLARNVGSLSLVLRNEVDQDPVASKGSRMNDLMAGAGSKALAGVARESDGLEGNRLGIEEIRGTTRGAR